MANWVMDLESKYFTIISYKASKKLKSKFPDINFTTTNMPKSTENAYPTVYVHQGNVREIGNDLDNIQTNAVDYELIIEVISNNNQDDVNKVFGEIINILKAERFNIPQMPISNNYATTYRSIMRATRIIGCGEI